jgi:hypothetical protein
MRGSGDQQSTSKLSVSQPDVPKKQTQRQPEGGHEESKGPAGMSLDSKQPPLKLLIVADAKASFFTV